MQLFTFDILLLNRGFNDATTPNGIFYQSWANGQPTINTGTTGLQNFGESNRSALIHVGLTEVYYQIMSLPLQKPTGLD